MPTYGPSWPRRGRERRRQKNGTGENEGERDGGRDDRRQSMMLFHPLFSFFIRIDDVNDLSEAGLPTAPLTTDLIASDVNGFSMIA